MQSLPIYFNCVIFPDLYQTLFVVVPAEGGGGVDMVLFYSDFTVLHV